MNDNEIDLTNVMKHRHDEPTLPPEGVDRKAVDEIARHFLHVLDQQGVWDIDATLYALVGDPDGSNLELALLLTMPNRPVDVLGEMAHRGIQLAPRAPDGRAIHGVVVVNEAWGAVPTKNENDTYTLPGRILELPEDQREEIRMLTVMFRNGASGSIGQVRGKEVSTEVQYISRLAAAETNVPPLMFYLLTGQEL